MRSISPLSPEASARFSSAFHVDASIRFFRADGLGGGKAYRDGLSADACQAEGSGAREVRWKFAENLYCYACPSNAVCYMFSSGTVMTPMISEHSNVYPNGDRSLDDYMRAQTKPDKSAFAKVVADYVNRNRGWLEASRV